MTEIKASDWTILMQAVARVMTEHADLLCEMDARMGDGDLGLTMKKGYCALPELYTSMDEPDMGKRLAKSGLKMSNVVPSTMGTLMSSGWMEGGKRLVGKQTVDAAAFADFLLGFSDGIVKRGKCTPGDRTVLDAILPAAKAAEQTAAAGSDLSATVRAALEGAKAGVEATKTMTPKYGKAAVFAAKALGTEDQGATAGMLLIQGLCNGIQAGSDKGALQ
ncbi:MAG: DAK2 domain-containing protein [Pseudoflavonifractor sp.]|nr:DAK2 domain-containing protein [Pseudoflavonifractor sp.]